MAANPLPKVARQTPLSVFPMTVQIGSCARNTKQTMMTYLVYGFPKSFPRGIAYESTSTTRNFS